MKTTFFPFVFSDDNEELAQAQTRLNIAALGFVLLLLFSNFDLFTSLFIEQMAYGFTMLYVVMAYIHYYRIKNVEHRNFALCRTFAIFIDIFAATFMFHLFGEYGPIMMPAFLWIILGNGIRFGSRYLYISLFITLLAFAYLAFRHPIFQEHWAFGIGWLLTLSIIPIGFMVLVQKLKEAHEALRHRAEHDALTDLPNRMLFTSVLDEYIDRSTPFSLSFIDLDGFKQVNDEYGHAAGDKVLKEVSRRLLGYCDKKHFVARLGGDEFVVISSAGDRQCTKYSTLVEVLQAPYLDNRISTISASIGISIYPTDAEDPHLLKKYADVAMYKAKERGKNCYAYYDEISMEDTYNFMI